MPRRARSQQGYVLVLVLASMAVAALAAASFSHRVDALRDSAQTLETYAQARLAATNARAAANYWVATKGPTTMGFGGANAAVMADGRPYRMESGAVVQVQDLRGLLSVNTVVRPALARLLIDQGVATELTDRYLDVLEDYTDTDNFKRLNGAEAFDYEMLGLPPPRNDFLRSLSELALMPGWRDDAAALARVEPFLSLRRHGWLNPYTAPAEVLGALFPRATSLQIARFMAERETSQFASPSAVLRQYGLDVTQETFLPLAGRELQITVWAPGLPQATQYNLVLLPGAVSGPWLVTEQRSRPRPTLPDDATNIAPFPLAIAAPAREP
jgi:general secretion pathway protein K